MKKKKELIFYSALVLLGTFCVSLLAKGKTLSFINADPTAHRIIINADNPITANDMDVFHHAGRRTLPTVDGSTRQFEYRQARFSGTEMELFTNHKYYDAYISNTERIGSLKTITISGVHHSAPYGGSPTPKFYMHWGWNYFEANEFYSFSNSKLDLYPGFEERNIDSSVTSYTFNFNNESPSYFYLAVGFEGVMVSFSQLEITYKDALGGCEATPEVTPQVVDEYFVYKQVHLGYEVIALRGDLNLTSVTIPSTVNGQNVIGIGQSAFIDNMRLQSVILPTTLKYINHSAFKNCIALQTIDFPTNLTEIQNGVFEGCSALHTVNFNNGFEVIGANSFSNCVSLNAITLPNSLKYIGYAAFKNCKSLTSFHVPATVDQIESRVLSGCSNLVSITVDSNSTRYSDDGGRNVILYPNNDRLIAGCKNSTITNSVKEIGDGSFAGQTDITTITIPANVAMIGVEAFAGCTSLTSIVLSTSSTNYVKESAFEGCTSLTSVTLPTSLESIEKAVFKNCTSLQSITIPDPVTRIGVAAFENTALTSLHISSNVTQIDHNDSAYDYSNSPFKGTAATLTSISVDPANANFDSRNDCNAIIRKDTNELIAGCKNTVIPNTVTSIGKSAFEGCTGMTSLTMPNSVTNVKLRAFKDCSNLANVTFSTGLTIIGERAFANCSSITALSLPAGLTTLEREVFYMCTGVTSLYLPATLITLDTTSFMGTAKSLTSIQVDLAHPYGSSRDSNGIFATLDGNNLLFLGCQTTVIPNDVVAIIDGAFAGSPFTSFEVPDHIYFVGSATFALCENLTTLTVASGNPIYDSRDNCNGIIETATNMLKVGIRTTNIPASVTSIENAAFLGMMGTTYTYSGSFNYISDMCFAYSANLTTFTIPNTVRFIGYAAFMYCDSLTSIVIPSSVDAMLNQVFSRCPNLETIYCEHTHKPAGWHDDWDQIDDGIGHPNRVKWYSETPVYGGNHWHYVGGVPTIWAI